MVRVHVMLMVHVLGAFNNAFSKVPFEVGIFCVALNSFIVTYSFLMIFLDSLLNRMICYFQKI